ncbi:MAG: T9SS type A sorting domain-containing protein [Candidatus Sabulitectum sp.]|nr:T9SS type A sorting domain-containing protein [Candidatus Sabulitectum sp.]
MYSMLSLLILLLLAYALSADSLTQTNWSGGGGVHGPVNSWGSTFYQSTSMNFNAVGVLQSGILPELIEYIPDINTGAGMKHVLWGDIDLDGDIDLLEVTSGDSIFWHEHPSVPGEWPSHFSASPGSVISVDLVEFESGTPVWVVDYDYNGTAFVALYYLSGGYIIGSLGDADYLTGVTSGDIDGNGSSDIIGWQWGYDEIWVWWSCHPDSAELLFMPHTPLSVFVFDGDGDGDLDMAVNKSWYPETVVYWNDGDWVPTIVTDLFYASGIDAGDIDGDDYCELTAVASSTQMLYKNVGGWEGEVLTSGSNLCAFIDLDNDGDMDVSGFGGTSFHLFYNCDQSGNLFHADYNTGFTGDQLDCADMNLDGQEDLILTNTGTGQIRWYEHCSMYQPISSLESSILNLDSDPGWGYLDWNAVTPEGTSVSFLVRASDDYTDMGPWSDTLYAPCSLQNILSENENYFQYKAVLATSDPDTTPALTDVTVTWDPMGIEDQFNTALLPFLSNPVSGTVQIRFILGDAVPVEICIFDLTGRMVNTVLKEAVPAGNHSVFIDVQTPGIYFCRMTSTDVTFTRSFVVIN